MRIVSQDLKYNFPYERACIEITDSGKIFAQGDIWGTKDNYIEIAKYSNAEKAQRAMRILYDEYRKYNHYISTHTDFVPPKIFKFPDDNEI